MVLLADLFFLLMLCRDVELFLAFSRIIPRSRGEKVIGDFPKVIYIVLYEGTLFLGSAERGDETFDLVPCPLSMNKMKGNLCRPCEILAIRPLCLHILWDWIFSRGSV